MSNKKSSKKSKDKKVSLHEFLAKNDGNSGTTQVIVQKSSSWADECDDDDYRPTRQEVIELPTAPRSTMVFDDESIPHTGPFTVRVANLPFDTNEDEIVEFFAGRDILVKEMRLARDDRGDENRLRGYGHIEFETRDDLISALTINDAMIQNRRIRIELAGENDSRDGRTVRRRFDYTSTGSNNESTNWREKKDSGFETVSENRRDNRGRGGSDYNRSSFQNRHEGNNNSDEMSNWRMGERQVDSPPQRRDRGGDRRDHDGGFNRDRNDRRPRFDRQDRPPAVLDEEDRPVLNLQPRTKPLPVLIYPKDDTKQTEKVEYSSKSSANVFGDAKPVDTAAREREIEAKLDQARIEQQPEVRKDIIVIKTIKTKLQEETNNLKKFDESTEPPKNSDNSGKLLST